MAKPLTTSRPICFRVPLHIYDAIEAAWNNDSPFSSPDLYIRDLVVRRFEKLATKDTP